MRRHFLRTVSHELRTPLTSVIGYAETLRVHRHSLSDAQVDDLLVRLSRNAIALRSLMDDLLDVDRLSRGGLSLALQEADVSEAVVRAVEMQGAPPGRVRVAADHVVARVDQRRIERIVDNLISNSLKHGGRDVTVWVTLREDGDHLLLRVEDDGVGIATEDHERVFHAFEQGVASHTDANPGSGVGLNLVRELARRHGGDVTLSARDGGGLTVDVRLPLAGPP